MVTIEHPHLGSITGKEGDGVIEFLGLKYGSLRDRFAEASLFENYGTSTDATSIGPSVAQKDTLAMEFGLIQHNLPHGQHLVSDTDGLRLNITAPKTRQGFEKLPVLVFIHGGAFAMGSAMWPHYSLARLSKLSVDIGLPTVCVAINYRVGAPGFLISKEMMDSGIKGNRGLRDQRLALIWLRHHIEGFNGDPDNMTVVGQSAGAVSAALHLASEQPLFKRLGCLGGQFQVVKPLPLSVHDHFYASAIQALGLDKLEAAERIQQLYSMPLEQLLQIPPMVPSCPVFDGDFCKEMPSFDALRGGISHLLHRGWCEELIIGDCEMDSSIFMLALGHRVAGIGSAFSKSLDNSLSDVPGAKEKIFERYGIQEQDDAKATRQILNFAQDAIFYAPAVALAKAWSGAAHLYHFNEPNPWGGPWKGRASHLTDLGFLFHNFDEYMTDAQRAVGARYASDLIEFVNGKAPWPALGRNGGDTVRVYGSSDSGMIATTTDLGATATQRRTWAQELLEEFGADRINDAVHRFLAGQ